MNQVLRFFKLLVVLTPMLLSCQKEVPEPIAVTSVSLNTMSAELNEGEDIQLIATVSPNNAENKTVIWSSSNSSIASVVDGKVTAIKAGQATITVKTDDGGKTATCAITVNAKVYPVTSVSLDKTSAELTEGDELTLTAAVSPDNATNKNVIWTSSDNSVASVVDGKVTAIKAGQATITVKTDDGGKTATCAITVNAKVYPVTSVSLDKTSAELTEGDELTLTAAVSPDNATNKNVTWTSSNSSVASVIDGKVTAIKTGKATITVKTDDGGKTATCDVVVSPINGVNLSKSCTANCYIVSEKGIYIFTPNKGNSSEPVGTIVSAEVLWESFGTEVTPSIGDLVRDVKYENGVISFKTSDTFKEGNALIAAKDASDAILWSWHIWLTDQPKGQVYHNAGTMMDRNLGATSATPGDVGALGLLYQWGRKDPYLGSSSISSSVYQAMSTIVWPSSVISDSSIGTIDYAISHPTTFIKGNDSNYDWYYTGSSETDNTRWATSESAKSIYDPCPIGWRVPDGGSDGVWSKAGFDDTTFDSTNKGISFGVDSSSAIWYPASGYRDHFVAWWRDVGDSGYYWSATPRYSYAFNLRFYRGGGSVDPSSFNYRASGLSVRCIKE